GFGGIIAEVLKRRRDRMSYFQAKARNPAKGMKGIVAVIAPWSNGQYRMHMLREGGLPFGSSAPESIEEAKRRCQETMGIQPDEWEEHDGEPFWLPVLESAFEKTVAQLSGESPRTVITDVNEGAVIETDRASSAENGSPRISADEAGIHFSGS